jgi:Hint domain
MSHGTRIGTASSQHESYSMANPITGTVTSTVVLGSAAYPTPLTIASGGVVAPTAYGATGVYGVYSASNDLMDASLTNDGSVTGGIGVNVPSATGGAGGVGVDLASAGDTLFNANDITGGAGGYGIDGGAGGSGAQLSGSTSSSTDGGTSANGLLQNTGKIIGGAGGGASSGTGGNGGIGVELSGSAFLSKNATGATIYGGNAGAGPNNGTGGTGLQISNANLSNYGRIHGGNMSGSQYGVAGAGGVGADVTAGKIYNYGNIYGGGNPMGTESYSGAGGVAVELHAGAYLLNDDSLWGGYGGPVGGDGGAGAVVYADAALVNAGGIQGGGGGVALSDGVGGAGGDGVKLYGTLHNTATGTIDGTEGGAGGGGYPSGAGVGVYLYTAAASLTNNGTVTGGVGFRSVGGAGVVLANGTLVNTGTIKGGYIDSAYLSGGAGVVIDANASVTNSGSISGGGFFESGYGSRAAGGVGVILYGKLTTSGTIAGGSGFTGYSYAVQFSSKPNPSGTLAVESGAKFTGAIGDFAIGDTVDITNMIPSQVAADFNPSTYTLTTPSDGTLQFSGTFFGDGSFDGEQFMFSPDASGNGTDITLACYRRGTRILTDGGEIPIENLKIGDWVVTSSGGMMPIRWIGWRSYSKSFAAGNNDVLPVLIRRAALGNGLPRRDLWVSPEHAMFIDGMLIPARDLINGKSIVRDESAGEVTYFHVEFDSHAVIYAEGAPSESFVDDESREMFDNAAEYATLYPNAVRKPARFFVPRVEEGWELEQVRKQLAERTFGEPGQSVIRQSTFSSVSYGSSRAYATLQGPVPEVLSESGVR